MTDINELRRLAQAATPGPWINHGRQPNVAGLPHSAVAAKTLLARVYSEAYGDVEQETANASFIAAANPATISELLDRLEAAEKERDALRAKIEAMERQEPVGYGVLYVEAANGEEDWDSLWKHRVFAEDHVKDFVQAYSDLGESIGAITVVPLYALPGAKGE
jgi:hypothetical protein